MNHNPTPHWSPLLSGSAHDDFANFVDFGDLDFSAFDGISQDTTNLQQDGTVQMDTSMDGNDVGILEFEQGHTQHHTMLQHSQAPAMNGFHGSTDSFPELAMQSGMYEQQRQQQMYMQVQQYHNQNIVPPTPTSIEMHGGRTHYYHTPMEHPQLHIYDHYRRQKDQVPQASTRKQAYLVG